MIASIDIGTSYSSLCILGPDGKIQPVDIGTGTSMFGSKYSLPSAVFVEDGGSILVGQAAMNSRKHKPENFRMEFKRNLGEDIPILLGGRSFRPEELYTELFRHMKARAEKVSGERIGKVYLTYPATYGEKRREKLRAAAKAAGMFDLELVDEPTAAAMCYCAEGYIKDGQTLLVYDFGGGTFDVSLIRYQNGGFQLLSEPVGLERCGGMDIDYLIAQDMREAIEKEAPGTWNNLQKNQSRFLRFTSQISELAVKVKHHLSDASHFEEYIEIGMDDVPYELTAERLNEMIAPLVGQTIQTCRRALDEAGVSTSEVSSVLLVGGTSRIPLVQEMARKITGKPALCAADLELAVARGALMYNEYQKEYKTTVTKPRDQNGVLDEIKAFYRKNSWAGNDCYLRMDGTVVSEGLFHNLVQKWQNIVSIAYGLGYIVGLRSDGTVVAVGYNKNGQCNVQSWRDIVSIACGMEHHTVGLRSDGTVVAVGDNKDGQCNVQSWQKVISIACSDWHTVGLRSDGTVVATGSNYLGCCNVQSWRDVVSIACGFFHTVGLRSDGTVVAVGDNKDGQCNVQSWRDIVSIACGSKHTVGLRSDGTVVAVGDNKDGQCNVQSWRDIVSIACGYFHIVGLRSDGTAVAVGINKYGQCNVQDWKNVLSISTRDFHTAAVLNDGSVIRTDYKKQYDGSVSLLPTKTLPFKLF